jgi:A/G-specific adenine glycosylase
MDFLQAAEFLLEWYQRHARQLPWRESRDPYRVWISEAMLQQTRVETVIPYYQKWMSTFPSLKELAKADERDVLQLWEGLGYYSRARNVLKTARIVAEEYQGQFPLSLNELKKLPGVGEYMAGAIASIALGKDEIALDGNGLRVLARLTDYQVPINKADSKAVLGGVMRQMLPPGRAGEFNQAIMDLGSSICTPKKPDCEKCPLGIQCEARRRGTQDRVPLKERKAPVPHHLVVAAVIRQGDAVLIDKRRANGLLGGLWEFPGGKLEVGEDFQMALTREICEELGVELKVGVALGKYRHAYTHFKVTVHVFSGEIVAGTPRALAADEIRWVPIHELAQYPMGKVDRLISLSLA